MSRVGDATTEDFGVETFDLVYTSSLVHHLDDEQNRDLALKGTETLITPATCPFTNRS